MNWGYKILVVYLVFVIGIVIMVFKSSSQKIDLVTADYYAKELKHQDKIDAVKRTEALATKLKYTIAKNQLAITLPSAFESKEAKGTVLLYCPSDDNKDVKKDFAIGNGTTNVELPKSIKGIYELQVSWEAEGKAYYFQERLFL